MPVEITAATFDPGYQRLLTGAHDGTLKVRPAYNNCRRLDAMAEFIILNEDTKLAIRWILIKCFNIKGFLPSCYVPSL